MSALTTLDLALWAEVFRHQCSHINAATSGDPGAVVRSYLDFAIVADHVVTLRMQQRQAATAQQQRMAPAPMPSAVNMQQPTHLAMPPAMMPPNVQQPLPPGGKVEIYQTAPPPAPLVEAPPVAGAELPTGLPIHPSHGG